VCKTKIGRDNHGTTMDNSLLGNALLENVFFKGLQAYTNANCGFSKFVKHLKWKKVMSSGR